MNEEVVTTPFGKFLINPQDCIGTTTKAGTLWDGPGFLQVIAKEYAGFGVAGTTILDIGANIGTFSVYCAGQRAWRVIAVEPVPQTMQRLKANLDLNQGICADVVIPLEVAAYSRREWLRCAAYDADNMGGTALAVQHDVRHDLAPIPGEPIDHYAYLFGTRVSLIKVDAQGCDAQALFGLTGTIEQHHPAIVFEWEADLAAQHSYTLDDLHQMLRTFGYTVWPWPSQPNNYLALTS
jgi:FkbM family methyltransferase